MNKFSISITFAILLLAFLPTASAIVTISEPKQVHNLGDNLAINFNISEIKTFSGTAKLTINCDNEDSSQLVIYSQLISVKEGEKNILSYTLFLSKELVISKNLLGNCFIEAVTGDVMGKEISSIQSKQFLITDKININVNLNKEILLPSEKLEVSGSAIKANNNAVNGVASVTLLEEHPVSIEEGLFSASLDIARDIKSGKHDVIISASDDDGNNGEIIREIYIKPIQKELFIEVINRTFLPEETMKFKAILLDHAKDKIFDDVLFSVFSPDGKKQFSKLSMADREVEYRFPTGAMNGNWQVKAQTDSLQAAELIYVKKLTAINIEILEGMLYVTNIGNTPYSKQVQLTFNKNGEIITRIENVSLDIGERIPYVLNAPEGYYDIDVETDEAKKTFEGIPLTGKAVEVTELSEIKRAEMIKDSIIAVSLILLAIIIAIVFRIIKSGNEKAIKRESEIIQRHVQKLKEKKEAKNIKKY